MKNKHKIVVYDNGGKTFDRYTIVIDDLDVFGMSLNPLSVQGFNQYCGNLKCCNRIGIDMSREIVPFEKLEIEVQEAINERIGGVEE